MSPVLLLACCRRSGLSLEEFQEQYEGPNRPVIITDVASSWPAFKKWTRQYLLQAFAGREVGWGGFARLAGA